MRPSHLHLVVVLIGCQACTSWQQVSVSPPSVETGPPKVRVTRPDGERMIIYDPRISGDSLHGNRDGRDTVLALADVSRMAVQEPNDAKNAAALTFVAAALGAALAWFAYFAVGQ